MLVPCCFVLHLIDQRNGVMRAHTVQHLYISHTYAFIMIIFKWSIRYIELMDIRYENLSNTQAPWDGCSQPSDHLRFIHINISSVKYQIKLHNTCTHVFIDSAYHVSVCEFFARFADFNLNGRWWWCCSTYARTPINKHSLSCSQKIHRSSTENTKTSASRLGWLLGKRSMLTNCLHPIPSIYDTYCKM